MPQKNYLDSLYNTIGRLKPYTSNHLDSEQIGSFLRDVEVEVCEEKESKLLYSLKDERFIGNSWVPVKTSYANSAHIRDYIAEIENQLDEPLTFEISVSYNKGVEFEAETTYTNEEENSPHMLSVGNKTFVGSDPIDLEVRDILKLL